MELFRMRCYLASLQGTEQPNPKNLLAVASRQSKIALGRLGIFSVSSFHALVSSFSLNGTIHTIYKADVFIWTKSVFLCVKRCPPMMRPV